MTAKFHASGWPRVGVCLQAAWNANQTAKMWFATPMCRAKFQWLWAPKTSCQQFFECRQVDAQICLSKHSFTPPRIDEKSYDFA
jgi:hypothetical protein